jgi:hypothetical protein
MPTTGKNMVLSFYFKANAVGMVDIIRSVADPYHTDADPDPDFHFDVDPDLDPTFHFDADPDPTFQLDADPDPTTRFFPDLDPPMVQNDTQGFHLFTYIRIQNLLFPLMRIRIQLPTLLLIRFQLPLMMRIRIRNTDPKTRSSEKDV